MTLEKQHDWIDDIIKDLGVYFDTEYCGCCGDRFYPNNPIIKEILQKHLPKENTHQKTTVQNILLYETGYKQGREDMKKEIIEKQNKDRETYNEWTCVEAYDYEFDESLLSPTDTK